MRTFKELKYKMEFVSPAFLGNAEQKAQWRTPPFKALVREWWRIAQAGTVGFDSRQLLARERERFGSAADGDGAKSGQSKVRLRLEPWTEEQVQYSDSDFDKNYTIQTVYQPPRKVRADLYLGYGPIQTDPTKIRTRIAPGSKAALLVYYAAEDESMRPEIEAAMRLAGWFGTLGSRSRNGWGSLSVQGPECNPTDAPLTAKNIAPYTQSWRQALECEWPHAIGKDEKGVLVWKTNTRADWKTALRDLAELRVKVSKRFPADRNNQGLQEKHILAYPLKEPHVGVWGASERMPNQLRFKIAREGNGCTGLLYHIPHGIPNGMKNRLPPLDLQRLPALQLKVWSAVHQVLDESAPLCRRLQ